MSSLRRPGLDGLRDHAALAGQGLRPLLEYLRGLGVLAEPAPPGPASPHGRLLEDYASYLVAGRSLAAATVRYYLRFARLFISSVSDETGLGLGAITTGDVSRVVAGLCGRRGRGVVPLRYQLSSAGRRRTNCQAQGNRFMGTLKVTASGRTALGSAVTG